MLAALAALSPALATAAVPPDSPAGRVAAAEALFPPWEAASVPAGAHLAFGVPPVDVMADFHGSVTDPGLVLYASGNYYFAMPALVDGFVAQHPELRGRVFFETLPPGLLLKQLQAGGTVSSGNISFTVPADVMMAEQRASENWVTQGVLASPVVSFATNDLAIMVPKGNPGHVGGLQDLARPGLTVIMPNPAWEGVAQQIRASLVKAGGEALAEAVYTRKVDDGTTILTRIHHRQTPLWLLQGTGDAGVTWTSEAIFQEQQGRPIAHVAIPAEQNSRAVYSAAMVAGAPHAEAARQFLAYIATDTAFSALAPYGFQKYGRQ